VVEDQEDDRQIIRDMLAPTDYEISEAENGEEALAAIAKQAEERVTALGQRVTAPLPPNSTTIAVIAAMAAAAGDLIFHTLILTAKAVLEQLRSAAHFAGVG
jgi:CheY-like chemotaxis protein